MKRTAAFALLITLVASVSADVVNTDLLDADPRFFTNFTSTLIQVNSTVLVYAAGIAIILGIGAVVLYSLFSQSLDASPDYGGYSSGGYSSGGGGGGGGSGSYDYQYARSAQEGFGANWKTIISALMDTYEKFDPSNIDCHKKIMCELLEEPESYGSFARNIKSGFKYAKVLEAIELPDGVRELLDEILDANDVANQGNECDKTFSCLFSLKGTYKRVLTGNDL